MHGTPLRALAAVADGSISRRASASYPVRATSNRLTLVDLVKSKERVADHGEVFTPAWMVEAMLDLVKEETERIDSRFLEPACGSGNFLVQVLRRSSLRWS